MSENALITVYDLHSHTTASDGLLSPEDLVLRAHSMGVNVLAITDHDCVDGLAEAHKAILRHQLPLHLVNGIEISTLWENHEIHIVGLGIDDKNTVLKKHIAEQAERRFQRAVLIAERLDKARILGSLEGVIRLTNGGAITRGHFARFLVEIGRAKNMADVFKRYLAKGKTGYAPPQWEGIAQAINTIHQAGGQAVLAHPGRYGLSPKWLKRLINDFSESGGDAMEVAQCQQPPNERVTLGNYAQQFSLLGSQGSDFHAPCAWIELGRKLWLPAGVAPVWQDWANALK